MVIIVNKRVQNAVLGCNLKNDRMISVRFKGKPFNIMVIQVYTPTSNAEEAEVEWFYEDLHERAPAASMVRANLVSRVILIFGVNQATQPLFSTEFSY